MRQSWSAMSASSVSSAACHKDAGGLPDHRTALQGLTQMRGDVLGLGESLTRVRGHQSQ